MTAQAHTHRPPRDSHAPPRHAHGPVWKVFAWAGRIVGGLLALVVVLVAVALIVIDLPWGRRFAARELNAILAPQFKGKIVVDAIGSLTLGGVEGVDAHIDAADGTRVAVARGVTAHIAPIAVLSSFLHTSRDLEIDVFYLSAKSLEAVVDTDDAGNLKFVGAFDPAQPPANPPPPPGRGLHLEFPRLSADHIWVHGQMKGAPPIDADLDKLAGSVDVPSKGMTIDLARATLVTRGMRVPGGGPADVLADLKAHLVMPSATGGAMDVTGAFDGTVGQIAATIRGAMAGDKIDAVVDVPTFDAEKLRAILPQAQVQRPVALHIEAHGPLAAVETTLHASVGDATLDGAGDAQLAGKLTATMHLDAKNIDARAFAPSAPASRVALQSTVHVNTKSDGMLGGEFTLDVPPGTAAGQAVPAASFRGSFDQTSRGFAGDAAGSIAEPGAPIDLKVTFDAEGKAPAVGFDVSTKIAHLADIKRLQGLGPGSASLRGTGHVVLTSPPAIDATVQLAALHLERASLHVDSTRVEGHAYGSLDSPHLEAIVEATGLHAGGYTFRDAHVAVEGSLARENVVATLVGESTSNIRLTSSVVVGTPIELQSTTLDVWRNKQSVHATIDDVKAGGGKVDVLGLVLNGAGSPMRATAHLTPAAVAVQSDSNGLDLQRLGYVLGMENTLRKGTVGYVVDATVGRDGLKGSAVLDMNDACFGKIDGLTGHLDAKMDGRDIQAAMNFGADGVGTLHADPIRVELGGKAALDAASWRKASGEVKLDGDVDLGKLIALLPPNTLPVGKIAGRMTVQGDITRPAGSDDVPDIKLDVKTSGLEVAQQRRPDVVKHGIVMVGQPLPGPTGIDFHVITEVYGQRGAGKIDLRLTDKHGALLAASASSDSLPFKELLASSDRMQRLMQVPLTATVNVPPRTVSQLPDILKVTAVDGTMQASLTFEGTALAPVLNFEAKATDVHLDESRRERPIAADLKAKYDGKRADLNVAVKDTKQELLAMSARLDAKVGDFIERGAGAPWVASTNAKLEHFPLEAVPMLADRRMHGTLDGQFELTNLHQDTRAKIDIDAADLRVGRQKYGGGKVAVAYDGKELTADVKLTQDSGSMDANAKVPLTWGANLAPAKDPGGPIQARFNAKNLRVGFLAPFLQSVLDSLDGILDADGQIDLEPNQKPSIRGQVQFSKGVIGVPQLGEDLRGVKAHVALNQDGTVKLDGVEAFGTAGRMTASGGAKLDGTNLVSAQLTANIAKNEAMPVTAAGTDVGTVYGNFDVHVTNSADQKSMTIAVNVPSIHITMPDAPQHSVQDLGELPDNNHIGVFTQADRFMALPLDGHESGVTPDDAQGSLVTIGITIGEAEIARGTDLRAQLGGKLTAKLEKKTDVTGQIRIHGGRLDVQGKSFQIETGTVTFTGDASNPDVKVTASWSAEDGTKVYADYTGPLQTGKVTLRSEPARPQNGIVALILFGTADGSESTPKAGPSEDTGTQAGTTVGGFATGGLSKGLDKLTGLDVTAKIDTSQANPRPEVEVQIARSISLELAVVLGSPPPGTNQDTTYATIDWRFLRQWSLETTFGNLGASIADVVWRHRY